MSTANRPARPTPRPEPEPAVDDDEETFVPSDPAAEGDYLLPPPDLLIEGDPPKMGVTKVGVNGITAEDLKRPRRKLPLEPLEETAARLPSASQS